MQANIHDSAVDIPELFKTEQPCAMGGVIESIGLL
jgi:hypothetical protein